MRGRPVIATTGWGHPAELTVPHLHFGVKVDDAYVDPLSYLPRRAWPASSGSPRSRA